MSSCAPLARQTKSARQFTIERAWRTRPTVPRVTLLRRLIDASALPSPSDWRCSHCTIDKRPAKRDAQAALTRARRVAPPSAHSRDRNHAAAGRSCDERVGRADSTGAAAIRLAADFPCERAAATRPMREDTAHARGRHHTGLQAGVRAGPEPSKGRTHAARV